MATDVNAIRKRGAGWPAVLTLVIAALLLSGCAAKSVEQEFTFSPEAETGLIIGSATSSKEYSNFDTTTYFRYAKADGLGTLDLSTAGFIQPRRRSFMLGPRSDSEFQDADGSLFALSFAPGDYVFETWEVLNGNNGVISPIDRNSVTFTVRKGEAIYIGNLHMNLRKGQNVFGISIIAGARPEILDKSERDIPMLLKRYPNLKREDITISILDDRPWGGKGAGHLAPVQ